MLESKAFAWALLWFVETLLTIPHEAGHALIARFFGFKDIRIVVGFGRPILSFNLLGFRWMFNRVPIGGFTLFGDSPTITRSKFALVVAAGPAVSALAMFVMWLLFAGEDDWVSLSRFSGIFFWANAIVLGLSVVPYYTEISGETTPNDGLILLQLAFPGKQFEIRGNFTKVTTAILCGLVGFLLFTAGIILLIKGLSGPTDQPILFWGGLLIVISISLALGLYHVTTQPLIPDAKPDRSLAAQGTEQLAYFSPAVKDELWTNNAANVISRSDDEVIRFADEILQKFPRDPYIVYLKAHHQFKAGRPSEAIETLNLINKVLLPRLANVAVNVARLYYLISSDQIRSAEKLLEDWFQSDAPLDERVEMIEAFVSFHLYFEKLQGLEFLEQWIRRAIAMAPDDPSLKATLGGVLVEQCRFAEAEPLLLPRIESAPNRHNQAYALFYVARIRTVQGKLREAQNMIERATILSDAPWLEKCAKRKLVEIDSLLRRSG